MVSLTLISWDRVSKDLAKEYLRDRPARSFLHDSFRLEYAENTGAAMSLADDLDPRVSFWLLGILPLAAMTGLFAYGVIHARHFRAATLLAFTLIFAGGIGNILDRLLYDRHVPDFMNVGLLSVRTGIFNFADLWISAGAVCLLVDVFKKRHIS